MDNQPFYSVLAHLSDFYDINMNDNVFENIAIHAWDHIGNKQFRLYRYNAIVEDKKVDLPCNVDIIEAVTSSEPDWRMPDNIDRYNYGNYDTELYLEHRHHNTEAFYHSGKLIDYQHVGNTLYFESNRQHHITVLYKGVLVDDAGLPYLNFKEVDAIAKYVAYVETLKKAMSTKDQQSFEMAQMLRQQWQFAVEDARTPLLINQNDMDKVLDVQTSWDRKRFGISFKPIR
jgi:hypothetical protein